MIALQTTTSAIDADDDDLATEETRLYEENNDTSLKNTDKSLENTDTVTENTGASKENTDISQNDDNDGKIRRISQPAHVRWSDVHVEVPPPQQKCSRKKNPPPQPRTILQVRFRPPLHIISNVSFFSIFV